MFENLGEQITITIILSVSGTIIGGLTGFFTVLRRCVTKIEKRTFRQSTATMTLAEHLDKTSNRLHPQEQKSDVFETVSRQLKDEDGKL